MWAKPVHVCGLNHIGILTNDLERVRRVLGDLMGLELGGSHIEADLGLEILWVVVGDARLEFIRPIDPDGAAAREISAGRGGVHHIALTVPDAGEALRQLRQRGIDTLDEVPRRGVENTRIGFLAPESVGGTLIEIVQQPTRTGVE